ncbi:hypothetical protein N7G274_006238 [Stereocaulon virgatum]|uniref:Uncharacterized protein n=1 Tax=Stereocaulon virgatum TaxID=373712 RepID=A0ABR4A5R0_9LECA
MRSITASIAAITCDHPVVASLSTRAFSKDKTCLKLPAHRFLESSRLLFDEPGLYEYVLLVYKQDYSLQPLDENLPAPACLSTMLRPLSEERRTKAWERFTTTITKLSLYLVGLHMYTIF